MLPVFFYVYCIYWRRYRKNVYRYGKKEKYFLTRQKKFQCFETIKTPIMLIVTSAAGPRENL